MKDATLKHLTGYADELYEQGDKKTADAIYALVAERESLRKWLTDKGRHHISCMRLDVYDERDHGCTCGYDAVMAGKKP